MIRCTEGIVDPINERNFYRLVIPRMHIDSCMLIHYEEIFVFIENRIRGRRFSFWQRKNGILFHECMKPFFKKENFYFISFL